MHYYYFNEKDILNNTFSGDYPMSNTSEKYLMNPATGSVETESDWLAELGTLEGHHLLEVFKDENGDWVEA